MERCSERYVAEALLVLYLHDLLQVGCTLANCQLEAEPVLV